jgi:hypothetical protein
LRRGRPAHILTSGVAVCEWKVVPLNQTPSPLWGREKQISRPFGTFRYKKPSVLQEPQHFQAVASEIVSLPRRFQKPPIFRMIRRRRLLPPFFTPLLEHSMEPPHKSRIEPNNWIWSLPRGLSPRPYAAAARPQQEPLHQTEQVNYKKDHKSGKEQDSVLARISGQPAWFDPFAPLGLPTLPTSARR